MKILKIKEVLLFKLICVLLKDFPKKYGLVFFRFLIKFCELKTSQKNVFLKFLNKIFDQKLLPLMSSLFISRSITGQGCFRVNLCVKD